MSSSSAITIAPARIGAIARLPATSSPTQQKDHTDTGTRPGQDAYDHVELVGATRQKISQEASKAEPLTRTYPAGKDGTESRHPIREGCHHAEVSAAAPECPEATRMLLGARPQNASIGRNHLGRDQIVDDRAVRTARQPNSATKGQPTRALKYCYFRRPQVQSRDVLLPLRVNPRTRSPANEGHTTSGVVMLTAVRPARSDHHAARCGRGA